MAANPKGSCGLCRIVKSTIEKTNNNIRKHILIYSFFYLLVAEVATVFMRNLNNYADFWFPLFVQTGYAVVFYSLFLYRERLKFCFRKNIVVFSLFLYYAFNAIVVLFSICDSIYTDIITYGLLTVIIVTLLVTIFKESK